MDVVHLRYTRDSYLRFFDTPLMLSNTLSIQFLVELNIARLLCCFYLFCGTGCEKLIELKSTDCGYGSPLLLSCCKSHAHSAILKPCRFVVVWHLKVVSIIYVAF